MHLLLLMFCISLLGIAQENTLAATEQVPPKIPTMWKASAIALTGATALDIASSWGKCCESNRLLASPDRRFGGRGTAIKSGAIGAQLLVQYLTARRAPRLAKVLSIVNFAGAGVVTGVAIRNYGVPQPQARFAGVR
jgi:hypothetical protein